ncbi:hypothetical protein EXIGLDRAFT_652928 [Exidia glandulosa HHB12029]|uniref:EthD domain-containing protein n=1 Tax=Exidia glandulosa HHB12029 TaxID=1314781 RepID=A0A165ZY36_EXIGL|nr:hypothetical protein EXIGLDRAFT_652928 [Exidia glandulosa HHB12029]
MALPEFVGGARYRAIDGQKPTWAGVFSVSDLAVINSPKVGALMAQRSEREVKMSNAYAGLDRRAYLQVYDSLSDPAAPKVDESVKAGVALMVGFNTSDPEGLDKWYEEEHLAMLRAVPGWVRTRRYRFVGGGLAGPVVEGKVVPALMALSEFASEDAFTSDEFKKATSTEWRAKVLKDVTIAERRTFKVFKVLG